MNVFYILSQFPWLLSNTLYFKMLFPSHFFIQKLPEPISRLFYSIELLLILTPVLHTYNDYSLMIRLLLYFISGKITHPLHIYSFAKFSWLLSCSYFSRQILKSFFQVFPNPNAIKLINHGEITSSSFSSFYPRIRNIFICLFLILCVCAKLYSFLSL